LQLITRANFSVIREGRTLEACGESFNA